jgi:hypothetical protein
MTLIKVVCAWCRAVLNDGEEPPSHGICASCKAEWRRGYSAGLEPAGVEAVSAEAYASHSVRGGSPW